MKKQTNSKFLLVGTPNVGKSTFYNKITWKTSPVANIDRVTTLALSATLRSNKSVTIIDLPGINNLNWSNHDEIETFKYIFDNNYNGVINIVSATTLKRDLYLTLQLAEAGILSMININMIDELNNMNIEINKIPLLELFKVDINNISAKKNQNIKSSLLPILTGTIKKVTPISINYDAKIENFIKEVLEYIPEHKTSKRFIIIQALLKNKIVLNFLNKNNALKKFYQILLKHKLGSSNIASIRKVKFNIIDKILDESLILKDFKNEKIDFDIKSKFQINMDIIFLNKWISVPIFFLLIALIWFITFSPWIGGWIQSQFAENALGSLQTLIQTSINNINNSSIQQAWWASFVSDGMLGGVFTIISFVPWIIILFSCMTILEQIGILSRMSIVLDKIFEPFGLSGRGILNLIVGVGCNIPSIIMAHNANSAKERIVTVMVMPFVSCSARVIVFGFITQAIVVAEWTWAVNLGITFSSILIALSFGYLFSNILFRKTNNLFVTELVRYRSPDFYVVVKIVIMEVYYFLKRVIIIVGIASMVIWILSNTGPNPNFIIDVNTSMGIEKSFLRYISFPFQYLMYPLGFGQDWRFSISLVSAFPAKEIAASNIETLFGSIGAFKDSLGPLPISTILSFITLFNFYIPCLATVVVMLKQIGRKYTFIHIGTSLIASYFMSLTAFAVVGSIESLTNNSTSFNFILITLLVMIPIFISIFILLRVYKEFKFRKNLVWTKANLMFHKAALISNVISLGAVVIAMSVLVNIIV